MEIEGEKTKNKKIVSLSTFRKKYLDLFPNVSKKTFKTGNYIYILILIIIFKIIVIIAQKYILKNKIIKIYQKK